MDKRQTLQGTHAGVFSSNNWQLFIARLYLAAMLLALGLTSFQPTASAQDCSQQCQQKYVGCLQGAMGDPGLLARCDDQYDGCWQGCL